jgi:GTP-binding protein HflX
MKIEKKLVEYTQMRKLHRDARKKKWMSTVWIVWYTNAWKSSLLNAMTKKWVLAENKLFATLGTNVWKCYLITDSNTWLWKEILLNDTIWFIRDLPPKLIKSFSSTLEDSIESDLLLHVIDSSDPFVWERIDVVHQVLEDIWANQDKILVFNKIDLIDNKKIEDLKKEFSWYNCVFVSVKQWTWFDELKEKLVEKLK